ncbi:hypothetical protein MRX96_059867 [Rhipicephalus microplus]
MTETKVDLLVLLNICASKMTELRLRFNAKKTKAVSFTGNMAEAADLKLGATDTSDSTTNADLGMSTTLKSMSATPSTSMKQLRSRPPTRSKLANTEVSPNPPDLQMHPVLRVHNAD